MAPVYLVVEPGDLVAITPPAGTQHELVSDHEHTGEGLSLMSSTKSTMSGSIADSGARPGLILATVAVVQFLVTMDLSVMNVGLPRIAAGLGFSALGVTWVIDAYALTFGGLLLLGGKAVDRFGRKRVLLLGLGVFGLASLAGGLAQDPSGLVVAHAVQGIGAAALAPAALALLTATFPTGKA